MGKLIICVRLGVYAMALTRGRPYEVSAEDTAKQQVRLRGDNERSRWFPSYCFNMEDEPAPTRVSWHFYDPVQDKEDDWVDVEFELSDGTWRWCGFATPARLQRIVEDGTASPGLHCAHLVVVRRLTAEIVERMLHHLDQQGDLIAASLPVGQDDQSGCEG